MKDKNADSLYCPSYIAKPGAKLYGVVNKNGFINYLNSTIEIDDAFIQEASKGKAPESRFRFAGNCSKSGCKQWNKNAGNCGLIDTIITIVNNSEPETLQDCPIRSECRWFRQRRGLACAQCNEVIRNFETKMLEGNE